MAEAQMVEFLKITSEEIEIDIGGTKEKTSLEMLADVLDSEKPFPVNAKITETIRGYDSNLTELGVPSEPTTELGMPSETTKADFIDYQPFDGDMIIFKETLPTDDGETFHGRAVQFPKPDLDFVISNQCSTYSEGGVGDVFSMDTPQPTKQPMTKNDFIASLRTKDFPRLKGYNLATIIRKNHYIDFNNAIQVTIGEGDSGYTLIKKENEWILTRGNLPPDFFGGFSLADGGLVIAPDGWSVDVPLFNQLATYDVNTKTLTINEGVKFQLSEYIPDDTPNIAAELNNAVYNRLYTSATEKEIIDGLSGKASVKYGQLDAKVRDLITNVNAGAHSTINTASQEASGKTTVFNKAFLNAIKKFKPEENLISEWEKILKLETGTLDKYARSLAGDLIGSEILKSKVDLEPGRPVWDNMSYAEYLALPEKDDDIISVSDDGKNYTVAANLDELKFEDLIAKRYKVERHVPEKDDDDEEIIITSATDAQKAAAEKTSKDAKSKAAKGTKPAQKGATDPPSQPLANGTEFRGRQAYEMDDTLLVYSKNTSEEGTRLIAAYKKTSDSTWQDVLPTGSKAKQHKKLITVAGNNVLQLTKKAESKGYNALDKCFRETSGIHEVRKKDDFDIGKLVNDYLAETGAVDDKNNFKVVNRDDKGKYTEGAVLALYADVGDMHIGEKKRSKPVLGLEKTEHGWLVVYNKGDWKAPLSGKGIDTDKKGYLTRKIGKRAVKVDDAYIKEHLLPIIKTEEGNVAYGNFTAGSYAAGVIDAVAYRPSGWKKVGAIATLAIFLAATQLPIARKGIDYLAEKANTAVVWVDEQWKSLTGSGDGADGNGDGPKTPVVVDTYQALHGQQFTIIYGADTDGNGTIDYELGQTTIDLNDTSIDRIAGSDGGTKVLDGLKTNTGTTNVNLNANQLAGLLGNPQVTGDSITTQVDEAKVLFGAGTLQVQIQYTPGGGK